MKEGIITPGIIEVDGTFYTHLRITAPQILKTKIQIKLTTSITEVEAKIIEQVIYALGDQIEHDNLSVVQSVVMIITENGAFSMKIAADNVIAAYLPVCLYSASSWRKYSERPHHIALIIAEELCHHFWRIDDEEEVKFKTFEVLKRIYSGTEIAQFYNGVSRKPRP